MTWKQVDKVALRFALGLALFALIYLGSHILLATVR